MPVKLIETLNVLLAVMDHNNKACQSLDVFDLEIYSGPLKIAL